MKLQLSHSGQWVKQYYCYIPKAIIKSLGWDKGDDIELTVYDKATIGMINNTVKEKIEYEGRKKISVLKKANGSS